MLHRKDLVILSNLRKNARESLTTMSKRTTIPVSTIFDRLKTFQNDIIRKHTTLIDFSLLGFNARANILLKVDREQREDLKKYLGNNHNINTVMKISSGYDFMIEGIFRNVKDVEDFLDTLGSKYTIEQTQVYYIIEDIKKEAFMNDQNLLDILA